MANYKFPGVYPTITDLSGVVSTNAVTACAYVGEAEYGPVNTPTLLSSLQDYNTKFGTVSSTYGYAGYSLAVAQEAINEHQFIRVVPTGDASQTDDERANNAVWGAATVLTKVSTADQPSSEGYWYEEVNAAIASNEAGGASGLFASTDEDSAFIVIASDPNNRAFYITTTDDTINEYMASAVSEATTFDSDAEDAGETTVTVTIPLATAEDIEVGSFIVITKMSDDVLNDVFEVTAIERDDTNAAITFVVAADITEVNDTSARVGQYPDLNERSFSITLYEKIGKVMSTLETFEYCTLYAGTDSYGESTFVEDMVNGSSDYMQIFMNNNYTDEDSTAIVIPADVTELQLTGGQSGKWDDAATKYVDLCAGWEYFKDRSRTTVSLLMNSGYVTSGNVSYQAKMLEVAEDRRDCFCLFDVPAAVTEYDDVIDWRKNTQGFTSYRGSVSSPWIKTYDSIQGRSNFTMCPSAFVAKIIGGNDPWMAPAGLNRGILTSSSTSPTGLTQYYDSVQGGILYADNQINCIIKSPSAGYVNWGQRTCQVKPSALDRINVARTIIYIETILRDAAQWHLFENNTAYQRMQINMQFSSLLNTILSANGIQQFQVVCDDSNNTAIVIANNQLVIDIYLWPTYTAEVIRLNSVVMGSDTTVTVTTS